MKQIEQHSSSYGVSVRLKGKSHRDIGSNPIHDSSSEGLHSIEV